jgi:trans-AT polyketide synthase/acyltransferase/oxidoreductase domain-containing protein
MAYAPAGDMFEMGARVQVLKRGVLFPMRANKLHALYTHYGSLDEVPVAVRNQLEQSFFKRSLDDIWQDSLRYLQAQGRDSEIALARSNAKVRMARVFRWYFAHSVRLAFSGSDDEVVNYQVHTGPAIGAFNQWVKGTALESWSSRHVDTIATSLLDATAQHLQARYQKLFNVSEG